MQGIGVPCFAYLSDLINAVCKGVEQRPLDVGVWYAERLERAAKEIREANKAVERAVECDYISPIHGDRCKGGRVQAPNAQFTQQCPKCKGGA